MEKLKRFIYDFGTDGASLTIKMLLEKGHLSEEEKNIITTICDELTDALKEVAKEQED